MSKRDEALDLGRAIRCFRGERTQAQVGEPGDFSSEEISIYETGRRYPRFTNLDRLAKGLGCTRLELEDLALKYRRARLLKEQGDRSPSTKPAPDPGLPPNPLGDPPDDPIRAEAQDLLRRLEPVLLELLILCLGAGRR